ncbi:MAG: amidohydrolase family protein [Lactobacillus sp.]|nr:amidohydrolase family protein [Lactobacillus sp.]
MPKKRILHGRIVLKDDIISGYLEVENGKITGISLAKPAISTETEFFDYGSQYIFPGFIDAHVHSFSNPDEGFEATSIGAAVGGVTTFVDMPYDRPHPIDNAAQFNQKAAKIAGHSVVDIALWGTIPKVDGVSEIPGLVKAGAAAFKMSTFETDPFRFPKISDVDIYNSLALLKHSKIITAFHSENNEMIVELIRRLKEADKVYPRAHMMSRPIIVETTAVQRLCEIAKWTGGKLHIVHVSAPETVDIIEAYRQQGVDVTCETCYQYLLLDVHDLERMGPRAKMNPPLREPETVSGLWQRLAAGKINYITSDHVPWPAEAKQKGDQNIFLAPSGLPGIELLVLAMFDAGVATGKLSPQVFAQLLATNVAARFGFKNKGQIVLGKDADFAIIDPSQTTTITDAGLHTRTDAITPLAGKTLAGQVTATWLRGRPIYQRGQVVAPMDYGEFVPGAEFGNQLAPGGDGLVFEA